MMFEKTKLRNAFRAGGIYRTVNANKKTYQVLPQIHDVKINDDYVRYVFTLPNGVDPKELTKKEYVFKQVFGERITIDGEYKKFVLTAYKQPIKKLVPYDYERFSKAKGKLPIICGEDINTGELITFDMVTHPHILNGGQTGGGKSTWLRTVLTFLIQHFPKEKLELYLCDLGVVEFMIFREVEHVKRFSTDVDGTIMIFDELEKELDKRQELMAKYKVNHIDKLKSIPYKICFVDEFQDLRSNDEGMEKLMRIGAKGRKLGVFLVLTTQRPSAAIVKGDIKANLTVSMAFKTKNKLNSNMILDAGAPNAAKLRGMGHAIVGIDDYYEIQTPLLEEEDAEKILDAFRLEGEDITPFVEVEEIEDSPMLGKGPLDE